MLASSRSIAPGALLALLLLGACSPAAPVATDAASDTPTASDRVAPDAAGDDAAPNDALGGDDAPVADDDGGGSDDGGATQTVAFEYRPQWTGVVAVAVVGAFGHSDDWMHPFVTLTDDGHGVFRATATLPRGDYPYLFHVTGDAAAATPATFARYAVDPAAPDFVACPMASPTYSTEMNPCSVLHVPAAGATAPATYHVRGTAVANGHPVAGWLAVIERDEMGSHHFFANRVTTGADGAFDLVVASGSWRVQLLHPTYLSEPDARRDPLTLPAARRVLSSAERVSADADWGTVETAYGDYAQLSPNGSATLPVHFVWTVLHGARAARMAVYGPGMTIGDPWYASPYSATTTTLSWDGQFDTTHARETMARPGESYWWGTWQQLPPGANGVAWTQESMVLPLRIM